MDKINSIKKINIKKYTRHERVNQIYYIFNIDLMFLLFRDLHFNFLFLPYSTNRFWNFLFKIIHTIYYYHYYHHIQILFQTSSYIVLINIESTIKEK